MKVRLDENVLNHMAVGRSMDDNEADINSVSFSDDGSYVVTAGDDERINLYNATTATKEKLLFSRKYGVDCLRFTHHHNAVVGASKNEHDNTLRYLSLHDNRYLRYFQGHRKRVVDLTVSPADDTFLSASEDGKVMLWDLRTNIAKGRLDFDKPVRSAVAFDPLGVVFAVAAGTNANSGLVKLYDVRNFDSGPFETFQLKGEGMDFARLRFSADGKHMLVSTLSGHVRLLDAFSGQVKTTFLTEWSKEKTGGRPFAAVFSPDDKYVMAGSESGKIHVWDKDSGDEIVTWHGHVRPTPCVEWNPRYCSVVSACQSLAFWCPDNSIQG